MTIQVLNILSKFLIKNGNGNVHSDQCASSLNKSVQICIELANLYIILHMYIPQHITFTSIMHI